MSEELKAKDDEILELFKMCNEKDKEIETHITLNKQLLEDIDKASKEIERLNNIIKEVREYIEEGFKQDEINVGNIYHTMWDEIYEILDKGE